GLRGRLEFQSTRPRGARPPARRMSARRSRGFNPRARVGRDVRGVEARINPNTVSIHAPAWGATRIVTDIVTRGEVSIHAPAWGATTANGRRDVAALVSIHAPAWGATPVAVVGSSATRGF